ncbi:MAG TPA: ABC transporter substrate-binding protein [Solirubrobacteraceae bacterium]|nr:ABC transporter substrate-binding protein [Solirubrobacteraceae bacterium]
MHQSVRWALSRLALAAASAIVIAACGNSGPGGPPGSSGGGGSAGGGSSSGGSSSNGVLTFAIFHSYSGPNAAYGPEAAAGCYPAERQINAAGGILGHQLHCLPVDSKGDPADAVPAANRMIASTSNLVGVLGGGSDEASAVVPIFQQAKIPIFSTTGQSAFDHTTDTYFWRILSPDAAQGSAMAAAAKKLGYTRVATLFGNDIAAQGSAPTAISGVKKLGLSLSANQTLAVGQPSYRSEAQAMVTSKPQAIISEADPQTSATYFSELSQLGQVPALITDPVSQEPSWRKAVGGAIGTSLVNKQDHAVVAYSPPTAPAYQVYSSALKASAKQVPQPAQWDADLYSVADYDSVVLAALAMDAAHSTKPSVYDSYITKVTAPASGATIVHTYAQGKTALAAGKHIQYVGATGPVIFNQWHNAGNQFAIERYANGTWKVTSVLSAAETNAAAP